MVESKQTKKKKTETKITQRILLFIFAHYKWLHRYGTRALHKR